MNTTTGGSAGGPPRVRLYVSADLVAGGAVALTPTQVHYLRNVMRLRAGAGLRLFNGRDGEWLARVERIDRDHGETNAARLLKPQLSEPGPLLLFAPLKKEATDVVVIKATELGVSALLPVLTRRTETSRINAERMRLQAIEAAEQCGRLTVPLVHPLRPLDDAIATCDGRRDVFVAHPAAPMDAAATFRSAIGSTPAPAFIIGPEGGFAEDELDRIAALPFVTAVRLGPRILRAETAALAMLVCWQALAGDWRVADAAAGCETDGEG